MASPRRKHTGAESCELPVDEILRRARPHPPQGEHVIVNLTDVEAEAFLDAILT